MRRTIILLSAIAVSSVTACTPEPKILKRYKSVDYVNVGQQASPESPNVSFMSLSVKKKNASKTVFDLAERGQAALLKSLGDDIKNPKDFLVASGRKIGPQRSGPVNIDLTKFEKRVVFTVERGSRRPADRMEWLKIGFDIKNKSVRFVNWKQAVTAFEKIDLGKLTLTQKRTAKLSGSMTPGLISQLQDLGFEVTAKNELTENQERRRRIVDLNVSVRTDQTAAIVRQGEADRDLDGNTIVDFELRYVGKTKQKFLHVFGNLWDKASTPKKSDEILLNIYDSNFPAVAEDVKATATMKFDLRKVKSGDETLNEGDDAAVVISGISQPFTADLISKGEQQLTVQRIGIPDSGGNKLMKILVYEPDASAACMEPDNRILRFKEYWEAQNFYDWLERSMKADRFSGKITITMNRYVLCLWDTSTANQKSVLGANEIQDLWIWPKELN